MNALQGETYFKLVDYTSGKVHLVQEKSNLVSPDIKMKIDQVLKEVEDYEPNSSISKNINMIFVDEYDGLREVVYSTPDSIIEGDHISEIYLDLVPGRFRDASFNIYNKNCLFGPEGTHQLYDSKNEIQV